jgi:hypothetical protein
MSLASLILAEKKPWLNTEVQTLSADGSITVNGNISNSGTSSTASFYNANFVSGGAVTMTGKLNFVTPPKGNESATVCTTSASAAAIYSGIVLVDVSGGNVSCALPSASSLLSILGGSVFAVGCTHKCLFVAQGATNTLTLTAGTGATLHGTPTVGPNSSRVVYFIFTNVGSGTEAYSVY